MMSRMTTEGGDLGARLDAVRRQADELTRRMRGPLEDLDPGRLRPEPEAMVERLQRLARAAEPRTGDSG
jgi:hypothetical protein